MPFQFEKGRYSLLPSVFVWGFDSGNPETIRPSSTSDPYIALGRSLQAAIARVGWGVEDFDVVVEVTQAKNGQCFRFVSEITGFSQGLPFTMLYRIGTQEPPMASQPTISSSSLRVPPKFTLTKPQA
jgi:hypothetical protein